MAATITRQLNYKINGIEYGQIKASIPTADVLTLNSIPVQAIAAPVGSGKIIEVISAFGDIPAYSGSPYASNVILNLVFAGSTITYWFKNNFLDATTARAVSLGISNSGIAAGDVEMIANTALNIYVPSGDPTNAGTGSDIVIYINYRIITL